MGVLEDQGTMSSAELLAFGLSQETNVSRRVFRTSMVHYGPLVPTFVPVSFYFPRSPPGVFGHEPPFEPLCMRICFVPPASICLALRQNLQRSGVYSQKHGCRHRVLDVFTHPCMHAQYPHRSIHCSIHQKVVAFTKT